MAANNKKKIDCKTIKTKTDFEKINRKNSKINVKALNLNLIQWKLKIENILNWKESLKKIYFY